jgi:insulysin
MKIISSLLLFALPLFAVTDVPDQSGLSFQSSDLKGREISKFILDNGLKVYLISDPKTDQSAAFLSVQAGSWQDPQEFPGTAHFCEHLLFLGTKKYPEDESYFRAVQNFKGKANAYTACDRTAYMFAVQHAGFAEVLDRFAHFFIDPLFNTENISRELHAVDQEFAKNIENDSWRIYFVSKELSNPATPHWKFSTGNADTLGSIPQKTLLDWHQKWYTANKMNLVVYTKLPIPEAKQLIVSSFSPIPSGPDLAASAPLENVYSDKQKGHIVYIRPIQEMKALTLSWELPRAVVYDPSKPADLLAYALSRGHEKSLFEKLHSELLIEDLSIRVDELAGRDVAFFQIDLFLSDQGMTEWEKVASTCFEALALYKKEGIASYLLEEKNQTARLSYEFQRRVDPFSFVSEIGQHLPYESLATFPKETLLIGASNPALLHQTLELFSPETCHIQLIANHLPVPTDRTEKWIGAEYTLRPISSSQAIAWSRPALTSSMATPPPNPYLAASTDPIQEEIATPFPLSLASSDFGQAYYWRGEEFSVPESSLSFHLLTPLLDGSPKAAALADLFVAALRDRLHPETSAADLAGITFQGNGRSTELSLQIRGFSEKSPLLLHKILHTLSEFLPTEAEFNHYKALLLQSYSNKQKNLAVYQALELADSLIAPDHVNAASRYRALLPLTYEEFKTFNTHLFDKTYTQALFAGNLSLKDAQTAWLDLQRNLARSPYPLALHPKLRTLSLSSKHGPYQMEVPIDMLGNSALLLIDEGPFTFVNRSVQEILQPALHQAFHDALRTRQKTSYIASASPVEYQMHLYHQFYVQSRSHQPVDLLYRFEQFLEEFLQTLNEEIPESRFETIRESSIQSLETRYRSLTDKANLYDLLAFQYKGDFAFIDKRIASLRALTYSEFLDTTRAFLARSNRKRLALLFDGRIEKPFSYAPFNSFAEPVASYEP